MRHAWAAHAIFLPVLMQLLIYINRVSQKSAFPVLNKLNTYLYLINSIYIISDAPECEKLSSTLD